MSSEGINGTISGKKNNLNLGIKKIKKVFNFLNFDSENFSLNKFQPFHKCKVKIKKELVPMGININKVILNKISRNASAAIGFISHAINIPLSK